MFFEKAKEQNIPVHWKYRSKKKLITYNKPLPIHITVSQHQKDLICKFENHDQWMADPLAWQSFAHNKKRIIFCQGRLSDRISASFEDFMCRFLDTPTQIFSKNEVDQLDITNFLKTFIKNKNNFVYVKKTNTEWYEIDNQKDYKIARKYVEK